MLSNICLTTKAANEWNKFSFNSEPDAPVKEPPTPTKPDKTPNHPAPSEPAPKRETGPGEGKPCPGPCHF